MQMDYNAEIQSFYEWLDDINDDTENMKISVQAVALWLAIMYSFKKAGYPEEFTPSVSLVRKRSGLKKTAFKNARAELVKLGRISVKERKGCLSSSYKINPFNCLNENQPQIRPQIRPQNQPQNQPQTEPQTRHIYNNNDINNINKDIVVDNNICVDMRPQNRPQMQPQENIRLYYQEHIGNLLSTTAYLEIMEFLEVGVEEELIFRAIDKSIDSGARNWNYTKSVINNLIIKDIKTVRDYELSEANRNASQSRKKDDEIGCTHSRNVESNSEIEKAINKYGTIL